MVTFVRASLESALAVALHTTWTPMRWSVAIAEAHERASLTAAILPRPGFSGASPADSIAAVFMQDA